MDEQLERLMSVTLPQVKVFDGKPVNHTDNSLFSIGILAKFITPGVFALVGSNEKILCQKKEAMTKMLDDYAEKTAYENKKNISAVNEALQSINNLIPSKIDDSDKDVVECIKDSSSLIQMAVGSIDATIQDTLADIKEQIEIEYGAKKSTLIDSFDPGYFGLEQSPAWSGFTVKSSELLQERANNYFNGPTQGKAENGDSIKEFFVLFMARFENIETSLGQVVKNMEKIQTSQAMIKEKQKNIEGLIKRRNEADRPKPLQRKTCVMIIGKHLNERYKLKINPGSIEKMLFRWDKALERGEKIPVAGYDTARNNNIGYFSDWVKVEFIEYYMNMRAKRMNKIRISSSEAAFNEAARKKSHSMYDEGDDD